MPAVFTKTTTVQNILDAVSRDVRQQLSATASPGQDILIDYINRVSLEMLRASKWLFLVSSPVRFVTRKGVQTYWIGPSASCPTGTYDTGVNANLRVVVPNSVIDRTSNLMLKQVRVAPMNPTNINPDSSAQLGPPNSWRQSYSGSSDFILYPAPDNKITYTSVPEPPLLGSFAGSALGNRTYRVAVTLVDSNGGESLPSAATQLFLLDGTLLNVFSPPDFIAGVNSGVGVDIVGYNVYATVDTTLGEFDTDVTTLIKQNPSPLTIGTTFTESISGLTFVGSNPPTTSTIEPLDGYVIEFQYIEKRAPLANVTDILQIPDDYKDVVIEGVNARAFKYLNLLEQATVSKQLFEEGLRDLVRDMNTYRDGVDFIRPDQATIRANIPNSGPANLGEIPF